MNKRILKPEEIKQEIKSCFEYVSKFTMLNNIEALHPSTVIEMQYHIHALQNVLISEYARHTEIKDELNLR